MLVLFTGSRDWDNAVVVRTVIERLREVLGKFEAIQGGARGLDSLVDWVCDRKGIPCETVRLSLSACYFSTLVIN